MVGRRRERNAGSVLVRWRPHVGAIDGRVVVLDENNKVKYSQLVPEIKNEPDYDAALAALK